MEYYCEFMKNIVMYVIYFVFCIFYVYEYDNNIICYKKGCIILFLFYFD